MGTLRMGNTCCVEDHTDWGNQDAALREFFSKDEVTIVVADVGLGGLSIMSEFEQRMAENPLFPKVHLVYYNCAISPGYAERSSPDKISIFNSALVAMSQPQGMGGYYPDLIFVACNMLSPMYDQTEFAESAEIPVITITDLGADCLAEKMLGDGTALALVFGTGITARDAAIKTALVQRGVLEDRVIMQACPELATTIQMQGADSSVAGALVKRFVHESWDRMAGGGFGSSEMGRVDKVYASLCCTPYIFSLPLWEKALQEEAATHPSTFGTDVTTECTNQNSAMAGFLFEWGSNWGKDSATLRVATFFNNPAQAPRCELTVRVVSMVPLSSEIETIAPLVSKTVAAALREYEHDAELFENPLIKGNKLWRVS